MSVEGGGRGGEGREGKGRGEGEEGEGREGEGEGEGKGRGGEGEEGEGRGGGRGGEGEGRGRKGRGGGGRGGEGEEGEGRGRKGREGKAICMCLLHFIPSAEPIHSPNVAFEYFGARLEEEDTPLERRQQMSPELYTGGRKPSTVLLDSGVCTTVPFCRVSIKPPNAASVGDHVDYAGVTDPLCVGVYWSMWEYTGVCESILEYVCILEYVGVYWRLQEYDKTTFPC